MITEAQRLAYSIEGGWCRELGREAAALLRRQEAALRQAKEALEYAIVFDGANQQIRSGIATLNELLETSK